MKSLKVVALSIILIIGAVSSVTYMSCVKSACKGVTCLNYGTCTAGTCVCQPGIGGNNCETIYRNTYATTFIGNGIDNATNSYPNNRLVVTASPDTTDYTKMSISWTDSHNNQTISLPIVLANFSATSSTFNVTPTPVDTFTFTGNGNISTSTISLTLRKKSTFSDTTFVFSNFSKQ